MRDIVSKLLECIASGTPVTYCRLVETRGSTPQKAGAAMLVLADGSQFGTLGGGCVEAEVKRKALAALDEARPQTATFMLDSDYGWDDGLICGGRMSVLIDPIEPGEDAEYFRRLEALSTTGTGCVEAIVFDGEATSSKAPVCYLFDMDQRLVATRHQTSIDSRVFERIVTHLSTVAGRQRPTAEQGIAYLPTLPRYRLVIVGAGHVGQAVAALAADLDFDISVVDDRAEFVSRERFPRAEQLFSGAIGDILKRLPIDAHTYCLIVTRGHNHDELALANVVNRGACYVGMIGSRRKIKLIFEDLAAEGVSAEALGRVFAPVGLDIGSQTVPEIAVSIAAELIAHRNLQGAVPGKRSTV